MSRQENLKAYYSFVMKHRKLYRLLRLAQVLGVKLPPTITASLRGMSVLRSYFAQFGGANEL